MLVFPDGAIAFRTTGTNMRLAQADTRFSRFDEGGPTTETVSLVNHLKFGVPGMLMDLLAVRSV